MEIVKNHGQDVVSNFEYWDGMLGEFTNGPVEELEANSNYTRRVFCILVHTLDIFTRWKVNRQVGFSVAHARLFCLFIHTY